MYEDDMEDPNESKMEVRRFDPEGLRTMVLRTDCPDCKPGPPVKPSAVPMLMSLVSIGFSPNKERDSVLIFDDEDVRHAAFTADYVKAGFVVHKAKTVDEAIQLLDAHVFDVVQLDHDLYLTDHPRTGYEVAEHIISMPEDKRPETVIVHTWNEEQGKNMARDLKAAGVRAVWRPFGRGV